MLRQVSRLALALTAVAACTSTAQPTTTLGPTEPPPEVPGQIADAGDSPQEDGGASLDAGVSPSDASTPDESDDASVADGTTTSPSSDAGTGVDGSAADGASPLPCTALVQAGSPVDIVDHVGAYDGTGLTGGPIADGTYVLTSATHYVEVGPDGAARPFGEETLRLSAGQLEDVHDFPNGDTQRFTATITASGTSLSMTAPTCFYSSSPFVPAAELGDWQPLEHEITHYEATATTLTLWVPRGNHEQVTRVYTRLPR